MVCWKGQCNRQESYVLNPPSSHTYIHKHATDTHLFDQHPHSTFTKSNKSDGGGVILLWGASPPPPSNRSHGGAAQFCRNPLRSHFKATTRKGGGPKAFFQLLWWLDGEILFIMNPGYEHIVIKQGFWSFDFKDPQIGLQQFVGLFSVLIV